ncbi:MAG: CAP domain-containing protein [Defluviitaleaceae bacterium]|nr:CAP domain-containing protein [Defluviitaleaceae bacterium]MCL2264370.1 CAP domain-containing protein [Defluviitaleaceae bacterium]
MKSKFKKRIQMAIIIAILSFLPLGIHQTFAHIAQSEQADWMIGEAKFIAEPIFQEIPITPFFSPFSEWDTSMPLPNRLLTPAELAAWNADYCEQGHISEIEREILRLTNIERAAYDLPPLSLNYALSRAARFKSQEMLDLDYFAHQSPVYGHFSNIPLLFINNHQGLVENLFALLNWQPANITAEVFVQGWMDSPGHRENILRPELSELGVSDFCNVSSRNTNQRNCFYPFKVGQIDREKQDDMSSSRRWCNALEQAQKRKTYAEAGQCKTYVCKNIPHDEMGHQHTL